MICLFVCFMLCILKGHSRVKWSHRSKNFPNILWQVIAPAAGNLVDIFPSLFLQQEHLERYKDWL